MNLTIDIPDALGAALKAQALAQGVSPDSLVRQVLSATITPLEVRSSGPFETGYGMLAKYGPAPSAEDIDENRRDMFRNFGQDL